MSFVFSANYPNLKYLKITPPPSLVYILHVSTKTDAPIRHAIQLTAATISNNNDKYKLNKMTSYRTAWQQIRWSCRPEESAPEL